MNETILKEKLEALRAKLEADQLVQLIKSGVDCKANRLNAKCTVMLGEKYARVDVGNSGKLMVELATGHIFGIKSYGVIHRGHPYGTLDTIADWYWGRYYPEKIS